MKKVSLKKSIFVIFIIMCMTLFSIVSYATDEVKETKESISTEATVEDDVDEKEEKDTGKTTEEIKAEMKKGIVGMGGTSEESAEEEIEDEEENKDIATIFQNLQLKENIKPVIIIIIVAAVLIVVILIASAVSNSKPKAAKVKKAKPVAKKTIEDEIPYKQENYEVYAKEEKEVFDKSYEKAETSAYKTLEENGFELPNRDEDEEFEDVMNMDYSSKVMPELNNDLENEIIDEPVIEEKELTQEDKLNRFIKRIEDKKEIQQGLLEKESEIEDVVLPEDKPEENLLGFDYNEEEEKPVLNILEDNNDEQVINIFEEDNDDEPAMNIFEEDDDDEPLLGNFDDDIDESEEEIAIPEEKTVVVEEKEDIKPVKEEPVATRGFGASSVSTGKKTNRFSFIEPIPENATGEGASLKIEGNEPPALRRKKTMKKAEDVEEKKTKTTRAKKVKEAPEVKKVEEEAKEENTSGEIDFLAEMEANMKKNKEDREKNKN